MSKTFLQEEKRGVLHFGGVRMALLDIEAGFWGLRRQMEVLVGRQLTDTALQQAGANGGASFARVFAPTRAAARNRLACAHAFLSKNSAPDCVLATLNTLLK